MRSLIEILDVLIDEADILQIPVPDEVWRCRADLRGWVEQPAAPPRAPDIHAEARRVLAEIGDEPRIAVPDLDQRVAELAEAIAVLRQHALQRTEEQSDRLHRLALAVGRAQQLYLQLQRFGAITLVPEPPDSRRPGQ